MASEIVSFRSSSLACFDCDCVGVLTVMPFDDDDVDDDADDDGVSGSSA